MFAVAQTAKVTVCENMRCPNCDRAFIASALTFAPVQEATYNTVNHSKLIIVNRFSMLENFFKWICNASPNESFCYTDRGV